MKSLFQGFSKGILLLLDIPRLYIPDCFNSVQLVVFHSVIISILCFTIQRVEGMHVTGRKITTYYLSQFFLGSLSLLSKLAVDKEGGLLQFKSYPLHFLCSIAHTSNEVLRIGGDLYVNRQIIMSVNYLFNRKLTSHLYHNTR